MSNYRKTMADALREMYPLTEETQLDEATMSSSQIARLKKAYEPMRDKKISVSNADKLSAMMDKVGKDKEALIQLFKADIPFVSQSAVTKLITKHNMKGAEINKLREEVDLDEFTKKDFDSNEDQNMHTENAVELARKFGTSKEYDQMVAIYKAHMKKGEISRSDQMKRDALVKKYLPKLKEEVELDEAMPDYNEKGVDKEIEKSGIKKGSKEAKLIHRLLKGRRGSKKEEVDLDEGKQKPYVSSDSDGKHVMGASGKIVKSFKDMDSANAYLKKNYNKLMKEEVGLDENLNQMKKHIDDLEFERKRMTTSGQLYLDKLIKAKSIKDARKAFEDMYEDGNFKRITSSGQESMVKIGKMLGMKIVEEVDLDEVDRSTYSDRIKRFKAMVKDAEKEKPLDKEWIKLLKRRIEKENADLRTDLKRSTRATTRKELGFNREEVDLDEKKKDVVFKGTPKQIKQQMKDLKKKKDKVKIGEELDENRMSQLHQMIKDKKSAEEIAKEMKLDVKTVKALMSSHHPEDVEEGAAADARRAMSKDKDLRRGKDSADVDDNASDDDVKGASKNIIMQMRKAQSLSGNFAVEFGDGKKVKIPAKMAVAVQKKYNSMKKPADKEKFQAQIAKSYKDMLKTLKAGYGEQKESILERMNRKIKENKDG